MLKESIASAFNSIGDAQSVQAEDVEITNITVSAAGEGDRRNLRRQLQGYLP